MHPGHLLRAGSTLLLYLLSFVSDVGVQTILPRTVLPILMVLSPRLELRAESATNVIRKGILRETVPPSDLLRSSANSAILSTRTDFPVILYNIDQVSSVLLQLIGILPSVATSCPRKHAANWKTRRVPPSERTLLSCYRDR